MDHAEDFTVKRSFKTTGSRTRPFVFEAIAIGQEFQRGQCSNVEQVLRLADAPATATLPKDVRLPHGRVMASFG